MGTARKGVIVYLLFAFGIAWLLWGLLWLLKILPTSGPLQQLLLLPGSFAPAIAALIVRLRVTHEGLSDAGLALSLRQKRWRYYVFALLLPLISLLIVIPLAVGPGIAQPDFSMQSFFKALAPAASVPRTLSPALWPLILLQLCIMTIVATPILWGEEFGWRSYLQLRLFQGRPLPAALLTGLIWGIWHYPLILLLGYEGYPNRLLGLVLFPIFTVLLAIIFAWLRLRSGSIWASSLAHAAINVLWVNLNVILFAGKPQLWLVSVGPLAWIPFGLVALWILVSGRLGTAPALRTVESVPSSS
jgi:membrane protease YdiL (CAAX protease family)